MPQLPATVVKSWRFIELPPTLPVVMHFDGACPLNPGPMGIGYTLHRRDGTPVARVGASLGHGTNNLAEYEALLAGLRYALRNGWWGLEEIRGDSNLIVKQMAGEYKTRDIALARKRGEAVALASLFTRPPSVVHVYRGSNEEADALSHSLEYDEKYPLAAPISSNGRALHGWQVQAIRYWWYAKGVSSPEFISRVMGVPSASIMEIVRGLTYQEVAGFTGLPAHVTQVDPQQTLLFA